MGKSIVSASPLSRMNFFVRSSSTTLCLPFFFANLH
jgi:hypothetical protein